MIRNLFFKITFRIIIFIVCAILSVLLLFFLMEGMAVISEWDKYGIETTLWFSDNKKTYSDGGFGDFTNYGEYTFNDKSITKFENNKWYRKVTEDDVENIKSYFDDYEGWALQTDFAIEYSFDKEHQINVGDYYYIYSLEGKPIGNSEYGKFDNYDVYYVDMEKKTVYHIHSNI